MDLKRMFNSKLFCFLLLLVAALYAFSLWHRQADIDDAWIGEHAYWLAKEGHARSELMRGITLQEEYLVVHHKLLNLHAALFIKIFGFSLYALKSVSLLYFIIFCFLFLLYLRKIHPRRNPRNLCFVGLVLLSFPWVFKYSFVYRPEMMTMTIGFAGWILLEKVLERTKKNIPASLLAGVLAGMCIAVHLNGAIVAVAGFILLIINRRYLPALLFGIGSLAGASIYLYDFDAAHGFNFWLYQFSQSPALDSQGNAHPLFRPFINLLNEHRRFFHNPMIAFSSVFIIFSFIVGYKFLAARHRNMIIYSLLLAVLLGMLAIHKARQYILIYFPFLVILVTEVYLAYFSGEDRKEHFGRWRSKPLVSGSLIFILLAFLISSFYFNARYSLEKFTPDDNAALVSTYITEDPGTVRIVAPMTFIFNEIENFDRIQSDLCYTEMMKSDPSIHGLGLLEKTKSYGISYIILEPFQRTRLGWDHPDELMLPGNFKILSDNSDYLIIKHTEK